MKESKKKKKEVKTSMTSTVEKRGGAEEIIKSNFGDDKRYLKIRR